MKLRSTNAALFRRSQFIQRASASRASPGRIREIFGPFAYARARPSPGKNLFFFSIKKKCSALRSSETSLSRVRRSGREKENHFAHLRATKRPCGVWWRLRVFSLCATSVVRAVRDVGSNGRDERWPGARFCKRSESR